MSLTAKASVTSYIESNKKRFLDELFELLRIPSVSADSKYKTEVARAAEYVKTSLEQAGVDKAEIYPTPGHPVVYAEKIVDPKLKTVLVYGHYDVQPPDPLELWKTPPFEPQIRDEKIYARGSCDDKGQVFMHIKALEVMISTGGPPCNIKFLIEGEEEVGSDNLANFTRQHKEKLKADVILISDTAIIANDTPSIDVGLRGLSYVEVEVTGPNHDLHSGVYGGAVANPIQILCEMITKMKDHNNHITIPGFYDDVMVLSDRERGELNKAPYNEKEYKKELGVEELAGESGYTTLERTGIRPTFELNGILGGYTGEGAKTVLPSKAFAKISMRLVPQQKSEKITQLFTDYFTSIAPKSVKVRITPHHGGEPVVTPTDSPAYRAAAAAMEETFGKKPIPTRGGGSIPIVAMFEQELGLKSVLMGFGLDSDLIHSPNEHFGLFNFFKGIETIPLFYRNYAAS
ncbi:MAG: dipeptidase [Bacteroidia bacterium]|nr:dipeptidase [Bacteroidia bacterium]MCZ2276592.1 dipeptidase [Bacteroidia bacterium]